MAPIIIYISCQDCKGVPYFFNFSSSLMIRLPYFSNLTVSDLYRFHRLAQASSKESTSAVQGVPGKKPPTLHIGMEKGRGIFSIFLVAHSILEYVLHILFKSVVNALHKLAITVGMHVGWGITVLSGLTPIKSPSL